MEFQNQTSIHQDELEEVEGPFADVILGNIDPNNLKKLQNPRSESNYSSNSLDFSKLLEDVQPEKRGVFRALLNSMKKEEAQLPETEINQNSTEVDEYHTSLEQAQKIDFSEEKKLGFLYKGGYDTLNRPIIVFVGASLPAKSVDPDRLLLYMIKEMDPIVVRDYVIVYVHSFFSSANRPAFGWLRKAYKILSRKYKKNLKSLFIIHPTFWIKTTFKLFKPFISSKFWSKLNYVEQANDIYRYIHRDQIQLPNVVHQYEIEKAKTEPIFGIPLAEVMKRPDHQQLEVPIVVEKCVKYLLEKKAGNVQGIFRLSGSNVRVQQLRKEFDKGENPNLTLVEDPHVIAGLLKLFLRELPEPLFPFEIYDKLVTSYVVRKDNFVVPLLEILSSLPPVNKSLLRYLLELLDYIEKNSEVNKMTSSNLSIVFAPNLIRSPKESIQQAVMHAPIINSIMRAIIEHHSELITIMKTSNDQTENI